MQNHAKPFCIEGLISVICYELADRDRYLSQLKLECTEFPAAAGSPLSEAEEPLRFLLHPEAPRRTRGRVTWSCARQVADGIGRKSWRMRAVSAAVGVGGSDSLPELPWADAAAM